MNFSVMYTNEENLDISDKAKIWQHVSSIVEEKDGNSLIPLSLANRNVSTEDSTDMGL